jgi:cytidylate kinase
MAGKTSVERQQGVVSAEPAEVRMRFQNLLERASAQPELEPEPVLGPYLTISREAASGGSEVARRVGELLGWSVLDRELVEGLAEQLGLEPRLLELVDETRVGWFSETLLNLFNSRLVLQDSFVSMISRAMALAASEGPVVIVGRAGNLVLTPNRGLRVRIVAPRELRHASLAMRESLDLRTADRRLEKIDLSRIDFVRRNFHCDPTDPRMYDMVINVMAYGVDGTAELIRRALEVRGLIEDARSGRGRQTEVVTL